MGMKVKYKLNKETKYQKYADLMVDESFKMKKKSSSESIGVIKFYDDKIIARVIKKSIDLHFKKLLELIVSIEESDEDPSSGLLFCLDEVDRFRKEMINKYERFLKKEQQEFLKKKISLIEKEVKDKLLAYQIMKQKIVQKPLYQEEYTDEMEEERHRSR